MPIKITFFVFHLGFGGVEKAVSTQSNMLSDYYDVEIISLYKISTQPAFSISDKITIKYIFPFGPNRSVVNKSFLKMCKNIYRNGHILLFKKKLLEKYILHCDSDIIISTRIYINNIITKINKKGSVLIAQEHVHHNSSIKYMNKLKKSLQAFSYFMPVSRQLCNDYNGVLDNSIVIKYIPHCIDYYPLDSELKIDKELNLICVGRLEPEKGFLYIIEIAKNLIKNNLNCKIHIIGDGSQMSQLKKAVADGDLINTIQLYGYREKEFVNSMLNSSRIFCMTSLQESFGIVLLEAFSYGLPCISFSSAQGACEIIDNGNNGYIIPAYDCEEYAKKIINLLIDKDTYVRMSNNARITSLNYLFSNVKEEWHSFIQEVVSERL